MAASDPYLQFAREFAGVNLPPMPEEWVQRSGWTKYTEGRQPEPVEAPEEDMAVFDIEVLYKITDFPCMACAASPHAWYAWLSPWVLGETTNDRHLIPLGDRNKPRIIVGHNVGYDRSRVKEEYHITQTKSAYLDTMSLHAAVNGMASRQRAAWLRHKREQEMLTEKASVGGDSTLEAMLDHFNRGEEEEHLWMGKSSLNSLKDVAKYHCDIEIDKTMRDQFGTLDAAGVKEQVQDLLRYCAEDVVVTHEVYKKVLPAFLEVCPHPVSFAALRHILSATLPINRTWEAYLESAEATYTHLTDTTQASLTKLANEAAELRDNPGAYNTSPWLRQLDWSGQGAGRQKLPGMPQWYRELFPNAQSELTLTIRMRIAPLLLKLTWDGYPLVWSEKFGWTFRVPAEEADEKYANSSLKRCNMAGEKIEELANDQDGIYFRLPYADSPQKRSPPYRGKSSDTDSDKVSGRCSSPFKKSYQKYFDDGTLSSEYALAKEALEMNAACSYWTSARERIKGQMVVWASEADLGLSSETKPEVGLILPRVVPMGTVTRRAIETTWLTASNPKPNRVGSELKAMVTAPPGYVFVGADVDSEELWIASLIGDAQFQLHGGNAIGFMNLEGTKASRTDLHSKTADILGISRDSAKVFNYGRIYGAGVSFATMMLRQFNPNLTAEEAQKIAEDLYRETKGRRTTRKKISAHPFWRGGTESFVFNKLEELATQEAPKTPVLGAGITEALMRKHLSGGGFMPSRINWAIQSSGVDYLHLLIVGMDYLIKRYNLDARLAITVHDEIRYLVKDEDRYRVAMALQVANVWTRAMFSQQMGIEDLPQSVAYFSAVDVDHVLRKEVDMDCVTPSHPESIPSGESLDIRALLAKGDEAFLDPSVVPKEGEINLERWVYTPREKVMEETAEPSMAFMKAQITVDDNELKEIVKEETKKEKEKKKEAKQEDGGGEDDEGDKPKSEPYQRLRAV